MSDSVKFNMIPSYVSEDLEEYYYVQVWSKDHGPYASIFSNEHAWRGYGLHSKTLEGLRDILADAMEMYAKVRIMKTTNEVIELNDVQPG